MILTILGSGPSRAIPREGCGCNLCRDARRGGKSARLRSSILIKDDDKSVLVDTSPDFLLQAKRAGIKKIDAVFFTHEHADATGGFADFVRWCEAQKISPKIYATHAVGDYLRRKFVKIPLGPPLEKGKGRLSLLQRESPMRIGGGIFINYLAPFQKIRIGQIQIESFPVRHGMGQAVPTSGYRINGKTIFISDFDGLPPPSVKYLRGAKIAIFDAAMWFGRKMNGHNTPKEALALAKKFNPKILYLTQTGHTWPPHDIAQGLIREYAKKEKIQFLIVLAYDKMRIKILD